jgi:predicted amidohydrolase YtcJ
VDRTGKAAHVRPPARRPEDTGESTINDTPAPELILHDGHFTTLDRSSPGCERGRDQGRPIYLVGRDADIVPLAGPGTRIIDLKGRRVLPGLIDNHLHIIRGGLNFNKELRWGGVRSLSDAM